MLDFKSTVTVWHTIHTASYAVSIGKYAGCSENELNEIFTASVLHDLGKMAIPQNILEYPGKLRNWEYGLMKNHVKKTEELIADIIPRRIANMAIHHHEKLNGTGYPRNLSGLELTKEDQIVEIADITNCNDIVIANTSVNLRNGPGLSGTTIITTLIEGQVLTRIETGK